MPEENGVPKRLRDVEIELRGHLMEYAEFKRNFVESSQRNDKAHEHLNDHLDNIDRTLGKVTLKVAAIVGAASAAVTLLTLWLR